MSRVRTRADEKLIVAKHLLNNPGHVKTPENLSQVKRVDRPQHLDAWVNDFWYVLLFEMLSSLINSNFQLKFIIPYFFFFRLVTN
jgi:hypothetical protein